MKDFIPLCIPNLSGNEKQYLDECIESTFVSTSGKFITIFEDKIAQATGSKNVVTVNSGTSALHLSLISAGVRPNDLVITSNYSFIATPNSIAYCHAEPVLIDVHYSSLNVEMELVEKFLLEQCDLINNEYIHKSTMKRVSAFVPVLALGNIINPDEINSFREKYNIPIILDAAAALGSRTDMYSLGELNFDYATISFNGNKIITCGAGGAILSKDQKSTKLLRHLAATSRMHPEYSHDQIGFNYRMPNINAALGVAQMEQLQSFLKKKKEIFNFYRKKLESKNFIFYEEPSGYNSSKWISGMLLENCPLEIIDEFIIYMNDQGIGVSKFWKPISKQKKFKNSISVLNDNSNKIYDRFIVLPSSINLTNNDLKYIVDSVKSYFKGRL